MVVLLENQKEIKKDFAEGKRIFENQLVSNEYF